MARTDAELRALSRRAYEGGRLRGALRTGVWVLPLAATAVLPCQTGVTGCALTGALFAVVVALLWRGQTAGRAVMPGLMAGLVALALPIGVQLVGHACASPRCMAFC